MAERRMFAKTIVESDAFMDMPLSTQALYFHLGMNADDDGFVGSPRRISRNIGASEDDMRILIAKKFVIPFETGIVVLKHWKINNFIRNDRYKPTPYQDEKKQLTLKDNESYLLITTGGAQNPSKRENFNDSESGIPNDNQTTTNGKPSIGKVRLGKDSMNERENIKDTACADACARAREAEEAEARLRALEAEERKIPMAMWL